MNPEFRKQVILATIGSPHLLSYMEGQSMGDPILAGAAKAVMKFVDSIEKLDDIHALKYEQTIVENTRDGIKEALDAGEIRKILPLVLTFSALAKTSAMSSLIINLQASFNDILKTTNGPASLKADDAKTLLGFFESFLPKYADEIVKLTNEL